MNHLGEINIFVSVSYYDILSTNFSEFKTFLDDGELCNAGDEIAAVEGPVRGILTAERTALNFL
ncbi:MAG: hypothetical protein II287_04875, partial [Bacteroidaceae bacterium]|nr:hypothetical protein [Bacteroidaceae bacterium]